MNLNDCHLIRMLPSWMRDEPDVAALASVVDAVASEAEDKARLLTLWDKIEELPEELLDELAWALDITWYDSTAPLPVKQALVLDSDYVHSKLGTAAAMESVAKAYLGDGRVLEWFDYGGDPHNFKIATGNLHDLRENQARLIDRILQAKRHSSKLESILLELFGDVPLCSGEGFRESTHKGLFARRDKAWAFAGVGWWHSDRVWLCMIPIQQVGTESHTATAQRESDYMRIVSLPTYRIGMQGHGGSSCHSADRVEIRIANDERSKDGGI